MHQIVQIRMMTKQKKIPPMKGEKHKKHVAGLLYKWCGRCSKWMNHWAQDQPKKTQELQAQVSPMPTAGGSVNCLLIGGF